MMAFENYIVCIGQKIIFQTIDKEISWTEFSCTNSEIILPIPILTGSY